jgi:hypothetical protein
MRRMAIMLMFAALPVPALPLAALPSLPVADACAASGTLRAVRALSRTVALVFEGKSAPRRHSCPREAASARDVMTPTL